MSKYWKILIEKLIKKAVVVNPNNAPEMSSIIPTKVRSIIYFKVLVNLFIKIIEIKNVIIIEIKPTTSFSDSGNNISRKLDAIVE